MRDCKDRDLIDQHLLTRIATELTTFGVDPSEVDKCIDAVRFYFEARGVLLNRTQDRKMPEEVEFYGALLREVANQIGAKFDPFQPV